MKKKKPMKEQYWGGEPKYNHRIEVMVSEQMYLFLKETAERADASISSLVRQSIRSMKMVFESDYKGKRHGNKGRGKETK